MNKEVLSQTTRAILVEASTQNKTLRVAEISIPCPQKGEVLIRVQAAGVNRADLYQRQGGYAPPKGASSILGLEVAGTVETLGEGVTRFQVGERVMALVSGGGYAEFCVAPEGTTLSVSSSLSFSEAAAIPEAYFTIWSNVLDQGGLKSGETLLLHGGTSGIGSTTIQLAKHFGARVIATARTPEKCAACLKLGADYAIEYSKCDFFEEVQRITKGEGVDVIFDWIGESYFEKHTQLLKRGGRLILIDCSSGEWGKINLSFLIRKNLKIMGSVLRGRPLMEKVEIANRVTKHLLPLLETKKIKPWIHRTFSFSEANEAHATLIASDHIGKIILIP